MEQKETSRLVQEILMELSDEQRQCIMLKYMENMKIKEIAELLGVSEGTVKSRLSYGLKKVEGKVVELEKQGTKLYGVQPIPFFLAWLALCNPEASTWSGGLWYMICQNIQNLVSGAVAAASGAAGTAMTGSGATVGSGSDGATMAGSGSDGAAMAGSGSVGVTATAGKGLAAKIIAAVVGVAIVGGGTFAVAHYVKEKDEDGGKVEITTTEMAVHTGTDVAQVMTEATTEAVATEVTTEETVEDNTERYQAYYDVVKTCMEKYPVTVEYFSDGYNIYGLSYVDLVDFNGDGNEQLVLAYDDRNNSDSSYSGIQVEVYDYADGEAKQILTAEAGRNHLVQGIGYGSDGEQTWLNMDSFVESPSEMCQINCQYTYVDGKMIKKELKNTFQNSYLIDGQEVTEEVYNRERDALYKNDNYFQVSGGPGGVEDTSSYLPSAKILTKKHEAIRILAEAAEDEQFLNQTVDMTQCVSVEYEKDQNALLESMQYNPYMEKYVIHAVSEPSVTYSQGGKAMHIVIPWDDMYNFDFCMVYENDVLVLIGNNDHYYTTLWFEDFDYMQNNSWLVSQDDEGIEGIETLTVEEYNQRVSEIMATY